MMVFRFFAIFSENSFVHSLCFSSSCAVVVRFPHLGNFTEIEGSVLCFPLQVLVAGVQCSNVVIVIPHKKLTCLLAAGSECTILIMQIAPVRPVCSCPCGQSYSEQTGLCFSTAICRPVRLF